MNTKVYNIIWADDEIDTLEKDVPTRSLFLNNGILKVSINKLFYHSYISKKEICL